MSFNHPLYEKLKNFKFVLASSSPRRLEILTNNLNIKDIHVEPSNFEENLPKSQFSNEQYVKNTSYKKGEEVLERVIQQNEEENIIVLSSDTIISCNSEIYEKPITKENQLKMFNEYKCHPRIKVITSVNVFKYQNGKINVTSGVETTCLNFNSSLSADFLNYYINSEEGLNVAGGFKIQCLGNLLFNSIEGDYFNIVGLPVVKTFELLIQAVAS